MNKIARPLCECFLLLDNDGKRAVLIRAIQEIAERDCRKRLVWYLSVQCEDHRRMGGGGGGGRGGGGGSGRGGGRGGGGVKLQGGTVIRRQDLGGSVSTSYLFDVG